MFSVLTITSVYISLTPLNYYSANNTRWWLINKTLDKTYNLQDSSVNVLFIGDSRPNAGINFNEINNSWSFCVGGTSPIENYYILEKYLQAYTAPETVFVSISPRFLTNQFAFWDLAVRNKFFSKENFYDIFSTNKECNDTLLNFQSKLKFFLYNINFVKFYQDDLRKSFVFLRKRENLQLIDYIVHNKGHRPHPNLKNSCSSLNYETKMTDFKVSEIYNYFFLTIFNLCQENNIHCIFFSMPMNESSFLNLDDRFMSDYNNFFSIIKDSFCTYEFYETLYFYPDSLFGDASHLNSKGQKIFTDDFLHKFNMH